MVITQRADHVRDSHYHLTVVSFVLFLVAIFCVSLTLPFFSLNVHDIHTGAIQFEACVKHDAWLSRKGTDKDQCMKLYVEEWEKQKVEYNK